MRYILVFLLLASSCFADGPGNIFDSSTSSLDRTPSYGQLIEVNESYTTITVTTADTYYPWISAGAGQGTGSTGGTTVVTATGNPSSLTIGSTCAGAYLISWHASFKGEASALVHFAVFKDGTKMANTEQHKKIGAAGRFEGGLSATTLSQLVEGDVLTLRCTSDTNGDDVDVAHVYLGCVRIGPPI